jgi:uncharacterized protein (DUF1499 family)
MLKKKIKYVIGSSVLISSCAFTPCAFTQGLIMIDMTCPDKLNCVSSQVSDPKHFIEPFIFNDQAVDAMQRLKEALLSEKRVKIVNDEPSYLRAEVRSLIFRFVDDVEFILSEGDRLIHIKSSARSGYSDFGVNRRRIERIRKLFQKK